MQTLKTEGLFPNIMDKQISTIWHTIKETLKYHYFAQI
jgi:hypothetical protein